MGAYYPGQLPLWWYQTPYLASTHHQVRLAVPNQPYSNPACYSFDYSPQNFPKVSVKHEQDIICLTSHKEQGSNTGSKSEKDFEEEKEEKNYMSLRSQKTQNGK